jgi:hypothetical protein
VFELWDILCALVMMPAIFSLIMCCCTTVTCTIISDNYSTDRLATDYTSTGTWVIDAVNHRVNCTSAGDLIPNAVSATGHGRVSVDVVSFTGNVYLIAAYQDANNYVYLRADNAHTAFLYKRVGGVDTLLSKSQGTGPGGTICICWDGTYVRAGTCFGNNIEMEEPYTGTGTGVRLRSDATATFDNLVFSHNSSDNSACAPCTPPASCGQGHVAPATVTMTVVKVSPSTCPASVKTTVMTQLTSPMALESWTYLAGGSRGSTDWCAGWDAIGAECVGTGTTDVSVGFSGVGGGGGATIPVLSHSPYHALGTVTINFTGGCCTGSQTVTIEITE